jgi:hypothetical protein
MSATMPRWIATEVDMARPSFRSSFLSKIDWEPSQLPPVCGPDAGAGAGLGLGNSDVAIVEELPGISILTDSWNRFYCKTNALAASTACNALSRPASQYLDVKTGTLGGMVR